MKLNLEKNVLFSLFVNQRCLINCPVYSHLRAPLYDGIICTNPSFRYHSDKEKFITTMTSSRNIRSIYFVHQRSELENFLMTKPECHMTRTLDRNDWFFNPPILWFVVCTYCFFMEVFPKLFKIVLNMSLWVINLPTFLPYFSYSFIFY